MSELDGPPEPSTTGQESASNRPVVVTTQQEVRDAADAARAAGHTVGLVPTMGYLHDGHASLMAKAGTECSYVVATIFVNPLQFAAGEDLDSYPRDVAADTELAASHGVDLLFVPDTDEMYRTEPLTTVSVRGPITEQFEGATRTTHFAGVATVVSKLFNIVGPCRGYFGEKDYQQLRLLKKMVEDLSIPVVVVGCPIVREADGLAMSSRNAYLTEPQRATAPVVNRALRAGVEAIDHGERSAEAVRHLMAEMVRAEPLAELDYIDVVRADDLAAIDPLEGELRLLAAVKIGIPRLIDNVGVTTPAG